MAIGLGTFDLEVQRVANKSGTVGFVGVLFQGVKAMKVATKSCGRDPHGANRMKPENPPQFDGFRLRLERHANGVFAGKVPRVYSFKYSFCSSDYTDIVYT